jgi:predicted ABC-type ATPase
MSTSRTIPALARCVIIAGPNGAGKTTFAREFLPKDTNVVHFVNADLIAAGLSALKPEIATVTAGRVFLEEIDRLAAAAANFAFETTFSGRAYATRLAKWKLAGYRIEMAYLKIDSPQIALKRIASRVKQGGHAVPRDVVLRRFTRSWTNFIGIYRPLANVWSVYDNSQAEPQLLEQGP